MRMTTQRTVILEYLRSVKSHPSAGTIYGAVKERLPGISPATVYRTLAWLRDRGEVLELTYGVQSSRYDGDVSSHAHLTCGNCERVIDIRMAPPAIDGLRVRKETGAVVHEARLEMKGLCGDCAADSQGGR